MGGRTIKYPKRRNYISPNKKPEKLDKKEPSDKEHEERIRKLKKLGILK